MGQTPQFRATSFKRVDLRDGKATAAVHLTEIVEEDAVCESTSALNQRAVNHSTWGQGYGIVVAIAIATRFLRNL